MPQAHLPWTPDFETYRIDHTIRAAKIDGDAVVLEWDDGKRAAFHAIWLRENSPDEETIHPLSREMLIDPLDIPDDIVAERAEITTDGALQVAWSNDHRVSCYHPGWLRAHAYLQSSDAARGQAEAQPIKWTTADLSEPPTFDGPTALTNDNVFHDWLVALRDYGLARLVSLPTSAETLEQITSRIGVVRATSFGRTFDVVVQNNPNSNAFTSAALIQHMDLATREAPPDLQFLFCRTNSTSGGEGIYVDGFRVAEDMRAREPEHFATLCTTVWEFKNRATDCDYRSYGPIFDRAANGDLRSVRYTPWLRAPLKAPLDEQRRAYHAIRAFMRYNQRAAYQIRLTYRPGDLLVFNNRRILHGRMAYDEAGGRRHLHGCYMDADDLHSAIRMYRRRTREQAGTADRPGAV